MDFFVSVLDKIFEEATANFRTCQHVVREDAMIVNLYFSIAESGFRRGLSVEDFADFAGKHLQSEGFL